MLPPPCPLSPESPALTPAPAAVGKLPSIDALQPPPPPVKGRVLSVRFAATTPPTGGGGA